MTAAPAARGRFITLEGGEGAGKSTQLARLKGWLEGRGHRCVATREPGGSSGAEMIRKLLVEGPVERWDGTTEALLHFAARREHLRSTVWPALKRGDWVLSDRFADSTLAYQGYGRGIALPVIRRLHRLPALSPAPDFTLLFDLSVAACLVGAVMPFRYVELENAPENFEISQLMAHYEFDDSAAELKNSVFC
jgi:dTMP kinase